MTLSPKRKAKEPPVAEAFLLIADLALLLDAGPLNKLSGCWEVVLDTQWRIAVNGHQEEKESSLGKVAPFHCAVEYNGFPAGMFHPYDGIIAGGSQANEDTFIEALKKKIAELK
mgnify:CR=1 FL=1